LAFADEIDLQLRDLLSADSGLAVSATRYVAGDVNEAETHQVLWHPDEAPGREFDAGDRVVHHSVLEVSSAASLSIDDTWLIAGRTWQTESVEDVTGGLIAVHVKRTEKRTTKRTRVKA